MLKIDLSISSDSCCCSAIWIGEPTLEALHPSLRIVLDHCSRICLAPTTPTASPLARSHLSAQASARQALSTSVTRARQPLKLATLSARWATGLLCCALLL